MRAQSSSRGSRSLGLRVVVALSLVAVAAAFRADAALQLSLPVVGHPPDFSHVAVVVMENKEYGSVMGSSSAPYVNSLASAYASTTSFYGTTHPSLPNYIALTGGDTLGISSNCTTCHTGATNIVDQLEAKGISWKAYIEGFPGSCFAGASSGGYAKKHNPFMYYDDITTNPSRCSKVVPLTRLSTDIKAGTLPRFVWITPDLCHSMHDCGVATGDAFLASLLPPLLDALGGNGVLFLTWDEGATNAGCCTYAAGGHVATVVAGPGARRGVSSGTSYDHYSILRTIEDAWGLPRLGHASCRCTKPMTGLVKTVFP